MVDSNPTLAVISIGKVFASLAHMAELKRALGLFECTVLGIGVILGAGIYALVGKAAILGGNAVWMSFVGAAVVAAFTGLSYAELASFIPRAGGEYHYARRAFGGFVAFGMSWMLLAGLAVASAAVALGFGGYLGALVGVETVTGAGIILVFSAVLLVWGIKESVVVATLATFLEVGGLVAVLWVGLPHLGEVDLFEMAQGWSGVGSAASLIFFAYIGFEEIVQLAEETRDPTRNVPLALVLSIGITTVIYVLVALSAISMVGWETLGASDSPLAEVFVGHGTRVQGAIAVIALFSTGNTVLVLLMSASRLLYGMAEDGVLHTALATVGERRQTPWVATLAIAGISLATVVFFVEIERVASLTNLAIFVTFLVINAAVISLRFTDPDTERPFRLPSLFGVPIPPVLGIVSVLGLMGQVSGATFAWGGVVGLVGAAAWQVRPVREE